ncbi:MAG: alpha/beta hydrolase [Betaproteobacteria bacterium]
MRGLLISFTILVLTGCTQAFFQPHKYIVATPGQFGIDYQPVEFKAADGTALFAWFLPARGEPRASVLYLHGNAENISTHFANVAWMPAAGFNVLAFDYRGYGGSQGVPTLEGVQLDIDAAMRTLLARRDVDPQRIIIFGQSLGGALAIHYAAHSAYRASVRAIVVDSAFSDYRRIVKDKAASFFLTWPFQWLLPQTVDNDFSPAASVHAVSPIPLLFIHGERDAVVPVEHSKRLYARAAEPKELWVLPEAGHIQAVRNKELRKRLTGFLHRHSGREGGLALR